MKIRYTRVRGGRRYFEPTPELRAVGLRPHSWAEGPAARAAAMELYEQWLRLRRGLPVEPPKAAKGKSAAELARHYPPGSIGDAFQRLIRSNTWAEIPATTRDKAHWPAWLHVRAAWGEADPNRMTFELMDDWQAELVEDKGVGVAHKVLKFWRWLWKRMQAMQIATIADPSLALRNRAPAPRAAQWSEGEVVRLAKDAWRRGERDLACIIAVTWDTMFQPGDVRTLRVRHVLRQGGRLLFDRRADGRGKTGRPALGTVSRRTQAMFEQLWAEREGTPDAYLFRRPDGKPYADHELSEAFRALRPAGETRQLRDMRRSGALEGQAGGASPLATSAKMANSIQSSNALHKTYLPVDEAAVLDFDAARRTGRKRKRENGL
ncbi:integrase [Microcystis phage vB_MweS-yong2]|nr:integrase [Microcystis phage vB_MweS-yong2]